KRQSELVYEPGGRLCALRILFVSFYRRPAVSMKHKTLEISEKHLLTAEEQTARSSLQRSEPEHAFLH
ncbi:uncharacterized, partial [Tachysurus ichikawai]